MFYFSNVFFKLILGAIEEETERTEKGEFGPDVVIVSHNSKPFDLGF